MKNNYWQDNKPIVASYEEKEKLLQYEVWMFRETCKRLIDQESKSQLPRFEKNLLVESLAIHTRILVDFFYNDLFLNKNKKKKFDRQNPNDIIAQDFMPEEKEWVKIRPPITQILYDAREKANKQLAHLSLWRIKLERDGKKPWDTDSISKDIESVIKKFEEQTHSGNIEG